jgi:hypothetical protein
MDIVKQRRIREWILLGLVGAMALVANLPIEVLESAHVERGVIMAVLGLVAIIALFIYVRFFFFLLYTLLAVGANLPEKWAEALNISQGPLLLTLISMVSLSLLNYAIKLLPTGLEPKKRKKNPEAIRVLLNAIDRGNPNYVKSVLSMEFDVNDVGEGHITPLMRAAQKGDTTLVDLLLRFGADPGYGTSLGRPADLAMAAGHTELAARLSDQLAEQEKAAAATAPAPEPATIG